MVMVVGDDDGHVEAYYPFSQQFPNTVHWAEFLPQLLAKENHTDETLYQQVNGKDS